MRRCTGLLLTILTMLALLGTLSACSQGEHLTAIYPTAAPLKQPNIPQSATTLGGSVVAFDTKFGASNCCFENGWTHQGPYGQLWTGVYTGSPNSVRNVDERSSQRVVGIENGGAMYAEMSWTVTQAKTICGSFLPPDAKFNTTTLVRYESVNVTGIEAHYTSVSLANTLPPSAFTDAKGQSTPPGTFYVYYEYSFNGPNHDSINRCTIGTDEEWVQRQQ